MGATAIVVPFPGASSAVGRWRLRHTVDGAAGMPPHVTLLWPFVDEHELVPGCVGMIRSVIGREGPFETIFSSIRRFADGVLYLAPEDPSPFVAMTGSLFGAFPRYPPYGGAFPTVIPHLTVGERLSERTERRIETALAPHLPLCLGVAEVWLMSLEDGHWSPRHRIPLGDA